MNDFNKLSFVLILFVIVIVGALAHSIMRQYQQFKVMREVRANVLNRADIQTPEDLQTALAPYEPKFQNFQDHLPLLNITFSKSMASTQDEFCEALGRTYQRIGALSPSPSHEKVRSLLVNFALSAGCDWWNLPDSRP